MSTDSGDFTDVDEAEPSSDYSFSPPSPPAKAIRFVHIGQPTPPPFPTDEDDIKFDSKPDHGKQSLHSQVNFVQKLYLQQQLRDNAVAFQRRQMEQLELKDCTFQPNLHMRSPARRPEEFLQTQTNLEAKRLAGLEKRRKEKEKQQSRAEAAELRNRPHLSPGTRHLLSKQGDRPPILQRLLSPKRTRELQPEISYAYHPLISPKAQKLKREDRDVHEALYRSKKAVPRPPPSAPFVAGSRSELLVVKQMHREIAKVCEDMEITGKVTREQFAVFLKKLELADDRDQALLDNCWAAIARKEDTEVEMQRVVELLESAVGKKGSEPQEARRIQLQFAMMHKVRTGSASRYHGHQDFYSHQPAIDPASRAMSPARTNFLAALEQYQTRHARHKASREQAALSREASECSFAPKINDSKGTHPLLRRMKSMSPTPVALTETSPRHDILSQYGTLLREERRLLPPPDHDFEDSRSELTFSPRRYASVRVRRLAEPSGYEKAVQRLQKANAEREEKDRFLARGEGLRKQLVKEHSAVLLELPH